MIQNAITCYNMFSRIESLPLRMLYTNDSNIGRPLPHTPCELDVVAMLSGGPSSYAHSAAYPPKSRLHLKRWLILYDICIFDAS